MNLLISVGANFHLKLHFQQFFSERRRSERVKREKPDYYDALEFENKRKTSTPTKDKWENLSWCISSDLKPLRHNRFHSNVNERYFMFFRPIQLGSSVGQNIPLEEGAVARRGPKPHTTNAAGRATLTWKKGKGERHFWLLVNTMNSLI